MDLPNIYVFLPKILFFRRARQPKTKKFRRKFKFLIITMYYVFISPYTSTSTCYFSYCNHKVFLLSLPSLNIEKRPEAMSHRCIPKYKIRLKIRTMWSIPPPRYTLLGIPPPQKKNENGFFTSILTIEWMNYHPCWNCLNFLHVL